MELLEGFAVLGSVVLVPFLPFPELAPGLPISRAHEAVQDVAEHARNHA